MIFSFDIANEGQLSLCEAGLLGRGRFWAFLRLGSFQHRLGSRQKIMR